MINIKESVRARIKRCTSLACSSLNEATSKLIRIRLAVHPAPFPRSQALTPRSPRLQTRPSVTASDQLLPAAKP